MQHLVSRLVSPLVATAVALGAGACATDDELGTVGLNLVGQTPSGHVYRLRQAEITVTGAGGSRVFRTEDDPDATRITARVLTGSYTADLSDSWQLERVAGGFSQPVRATLISPDPAPFEVVADATATVALRFRVEGEDVTLTEGDFDIVVEIEEGMPQSPITPVGSYDPLPSTTAYAGHFIAGMPIDLPRAATLSGIGWVVYTPGARYRLALYSDSNGVPGSLLAETDERVTVTGRQEMPTAPVSLAPGRYWVMGYYDLDMALGTDEGRRTTQWYSYYSYGQPLPTTYPTASGGFYDSPTLNFFLQVRFR